MFVPQPFPLSGWWRPGGCGPDGCAMEEVNVTSPGEAGWRADVALVRRWDGSWVQLGSHGDLHGTRAGLIVVALPTACTHKATAAARCQARCAIRDTLLNLVPSHTFPLFCHSSTNPLPIHNLNHEARPSPKSQTAPVPPAALVAADWSVCRDRCGGRRGRSGTRGCRRR